MKHMDEAARAQAAGEGEAAETPAGLDLERLQRELDEDPTLQAILEEVRRGAAAQLLEGQLAAIGRLHTFEGACGAYRLASKYFDNISVDLIYALEGQSVESWMDSLEKIIALDPAHISCYCLKV